MNGILGLHSHWPVSRVVLVLLLMYTLKEDLIFDLSGGSIVRYPKASSLFCRVYTILCNLWVVYLSWSLLPMQYSTWFLTPLISRPWHFIRYDSITSFLESFWILPWTMWCNIPLELPFSLVDSFQWSVPYTRFPCNWHGWLHKLIYIIIQGQAHFNEFVKCFFIINSLPPFSFFFHAVFYANELLRLTLHTSY